MRWIERRPQGDDEMVVADHAGLGLDLGCRGVDTGDGFMDEFDAAP